MTVTVQQNYQFLSAEDADRAYEPGTVEWAVKLRDRIHDCAESVQQNRVLFSRSSQLLRERNGYSLLTKKDGSTFQTWTEFCTYRRPWGLGYDTDDIQRIIDENAKPATARKLEQAKAENPTATQAELAEAVGVSDRHVRHLQEETTVSDKRKARNSANTTARQIYLPQCPEAAARKVREKFGPDFASQLKEAL